MGHETSGNKKYAIISGVVIGVVVGVVIALMASQQNVELQTPEVEQQIPEVQRNETGTEESVPETSTEPTAVSIETGASDQNSGRSFDPNEITVAIGTTVVWTNGDTASHTVTSGNPGDSDAGSVFDSAGLIPPGEAFEHTFDTAGEFPYFCQAHPWTTGKVIVTAMEVEQSEEGTGEEASGLATISLAPDSATAGAQISIEGMGFAALDSVVINFDNSVLPSTPPYVVTDAVGAFSTSITIPIDAPSGEHEISVTGSSGSSATAVFIVQ
jgi:plastocyanin